MKKYLIIFTILVLQLTISFSVFKSEIVSLKNGEKVMLNANKTWNYYVPDPRDKVITFKNLKFGSSVNQFYKEYAKQKNKIRSMPNEGLYYFNHDFAYEPAILMYYFKNDRFIKGDAIITVSPPNQETYVAKYLKIKKLLKSLYGKPTGGDSLSTEWDFTRYQVKLMFAKEGGKLSLKASYTEKAQTQTQLNSKNKYIKEKSSADIAQPKKVHEPTSPMPAEVADPEEPIIGDNVKELDLQKMQDLIKRLNN